VVLLTGFEPFTTGRGLSLSHNPTADIALAVGSETAGVTGAVLPVSYAKTPVTLAGLFEAHHPRIWVGLGYAPHRETLDIEQIAVNVAHANRGDNDGACPQSEAVVEGGPVAYETALDIPAAVACFKGHGVVAQPAFHAGTFMCNQVFYLGCHRRAQGALDLAAFIHVPPMDDFGPFSRGLAAVLTDLMEAQRGPA
jgi:pyroglutamyl-peptidase